LIKGQMKSVGKLFDPSNHQEDVSKKANRLSFYPLKADLSRNIEGVPKRGEPWIRLTETLPYLIDETKLPTPLPEELFHMGIDPQTEAAYDIYNLFVMMPERLGPTFSIASRTRSFLYSRSSLLRIFARL